MGSGILERFVTMHLVPETFYPMAVWDYKFAWSPQVCDKSGQKIWLKYAYCGVAEYHPLMWKEKPIKEIRWLSTEEFIIRSLKGSLYGDS
jgi:hypothetical protein